MKKENLHHHKISQHSTVGRPYNALGIDHNIVMRDVRLMASTVPLKCNVALTRTCQVANYQLKASHS